MGTDKVYCLNCKGPLQDRALLDAAFADIAAQVTDGAQPVLTPVCGKCFTVHWHDGKSVRLPTAEETTLIANTIGPVIEQMKAATRGDAEHPSDILWEAIRTLRRKMLELSTAVAIKSLDNQIGDKANQLISDTLNDENRRIVGNRNINTRNPTWSDARLALIATLSHALQILEKDSNG